MMLLERETPTQKRKEDSETGRQADKETDKEIERMNKGRRRKKEII